MISIKGSTTSIPKALKRNRLNILALSALLSFQTTNANAEATFNFGEDKSVTLGLGFRSSFTSTKGAAPDGKSRSTDFNVNSTRLYTSASLNKYIKGTLNVEGNNGGESPGNSKFFEEVKVFDAIARFEFMPEFNIWAGRMLVPNDRSNLDGPYYLSSFTYPGLTAAYPSQTNGRDTGVTVWGKLFDNHLTYATGAFEGHNNVKAASSESDNLMYAGRLQYDFWDANPIPAYYTASTLYGKDILAIAFATNFQKDGVGSAVKKGDYFGYNVDVLMEKKFDAGVLDIEGAIYKFDTEGVSDVSSTFSSKFSRVANVGGIKEGNAYLASANFLFPQVVGVGKFQPFVRYQKFAADSTKGDGVDSIDVASNNIKQYDVGVNYVIEGHSARITAAYSKTKNDAPSVRDSNTYLLGLQLQF